MRPSSGTGWPWGSLRIFNVIACDCKCLPPLQIAHQFEGVSMTHAGQHQVRSKSHLAKKQTGEYRTSNWKVTSCLFEGRMVRWAEGRERATSRRRKRSMRRRSIKWESVFEFGAILIMVPWSLDSTAFSHCKQIVFLGHFSKLTIHSFGFSQE